MDQQSIADKIDGKKVTDDILTMVQRVEIHCEDFYITNVETE